MYTIYMQTFTVVNGSVVEASNPELIGYTDELDDDMLEPDHVFEDGDHNVIVWIDDQDEVIGQTLRD